MQERLPSIAAIVCTLDRGPAIERTLAALRDQDLPESEYEVLIVDNGSSPENRRILEEAVRAGPPNLRYVREDRIGESSARNRALQDCQADLLAFIDDDAIARPGWLGAIREAFARQSGLGAIGGRVILDLEVERPAWLDDELLPYLSGFDRGGDQQGLEFPDYPRGANMAFRRKVFATGAVFDDRLGLQGPCLLTMSETEMCYRVAKAGWEVAYLPQAEVLHLISANRIRPEWFARRVHWQGRSRCTFEGLHFGRAHLLSRIPGQILAGLRKRGIQRRLHMGYLAAWVPTFFRDLSPRPSVPAPG
ncbi:MAG: glycosyltransferase family 2 protein [Planctomycetota bacterium]